jgi:hypothetical protein
MLNGELDSLAGAVLAQFGIIIWFNIVGFTVAVGVAEELLPAIRVPSGRAFRSLRGRSLSTAAIQGAIVGSTVGLIDYAIVGGTSLTTALPVVTLSSAIGFAIAEGLMIGISGPAPTSANPAWSDADTGRPEPPLAKAWKRGYVQTLIGSATGLFIVLASTGVFQTGLEYYGRAGLSWLIGVAIVGVALRVTGCTGAGATAVALAVLTPLVLYGMGDMYNPSTRWVLVQTTLLFPIIARWLVLWLSEQRSKRPD